MNYRLIGCLVGRRILVLHGSSELLEGQWRDEYRSLMQDFVMLHNYYGIVA